MSRNYVPAPCVGLDDVIKDLLRYLDDSVLVLEAVEVSVCGDALQVAGLVQRLRQSQVRLPRE
jgi:hypothetical protein